MTAVAPLSPYSRVVPLLEKTARDSRRWEIPENFLAEKPAIISFLNAHAVNTAFRNSDFYHLLSVSDWLLRDGIGVKLALKFFDLGETENLNGTDLITFLIRHYRDSRIVLFGASDAALSACTKRLQGEGISLLATAHGFHDDEFYIDKCRTLQPDVVILCMGMPRQEILALKMREHKSAGLLICGGGWADFYSGVKIRAPEWMRSVSLEWLHRLLQEPKRLGKRYTIDLLFFFYLLARAKHAGRA